MALDRSQILGAMDLRREEVQVPEWGGTVVVRGLTGKERDSYEESLMRGRGQINYDNARAKLLVRCIVDDDGHQLFAETDADALGSKAGAVLDRLFTVAARLSGLRPGDVDELLGNSGSGGGGGLPSPSLSDSA